MRITIIGAPASGKSSLTDGLVALFPQTRTFGVRRYFAHEIERGSRMGAAAAHYVAKQSWIPDDLVAEAVAHEIDAGRLGDGFILEGMPGNAAQAELLNEVLRARSMSLDAAVHVHTPPAVCAERASRRLVCQVCDGGSHQARADTQGRCLTCRTPVSRRETDATDAFAARLTQFGALEGPMVDYYTHTGQLVTLDGEKDRMDVLADCLRALNLRSSAVLAADGGAR